MINYGELLQKMLETSCDRIDFVYDIGVYDLVAMDLYNEHEIDLDRNPEGFATTEMIRILVEAVEQWENDTLKNRYDLSE